MKKTKKKVDKETKAEGAAMFESKEDGLKAKKSVTKKIGNARDTLRSYVKDNGLKKGKDYAQDKKHGKAWSKLNAAVETLEGERKSILEFLKESKGVKGSRANNYGYPDEVLNAEDPAEAKKKYRVQMRNRATKAGVSREEYMENMEKYDKEIEAKKGSKKPKAEKEAKADKKADKKKADKKPKEEAKAKKPKKKKKTED